MIKIFEKSFIKKNKNWFISCHHRAPKHNIAMEPFNGTMKQYQTEYRKQPLKKFMKNAQQYDVDNAPFQTEIQISANLMHMIPISFMMKKKKTATSTFSCFALTLNLQLREKMSILLQMPPTKVSTNGRSKHSIFGRL